MVQVFRGIPYAEPALSLNVWTDDPAGSRPVMVWIHGGGYVFGSADRPEYDGTVLARDGVVLVTVDYRVGADGFGLVEGAPANRGLLDQVAALEWVQENITGFGGDPSRVTVFGQSAGGGSVAALLAMPRAAGLFRRAIVQSMSGTYFTPELAADLATGTDTGRWGRPGLRGVLLSPVVDGNTLPTDPWTALQDGAARDVELLIGHTRHEHRLFSFLDGVLGRVTPEQAASAVARFAPPGAAYPGTAEEVYDQVHSDWLFRMPSLHLAEAHTGTRFLYELTWPAPGLDGALGACHGLDVPLVFGNLTQGEPAMLIGDDPAPAVEVSARMRAAWTAFARDGDPGWPAYGPDRLTGIFGAGFSVDPYPEEASRRIWQDHTFAALPLVAPRHGSDPDDDSSGQ